MSRTERHTVLDWAEQLDTQRRATTRGTSWAELDAAIHANLTHAPGSLADPGTEALCDQALLPTQPTTLAGAHRMPAPVTTIPMPERPPTARATQPSERTLQRWAHTNRLVEQAHKAGQAEGEHKGEVNGWRRGVWSGIVLGAVLASLGWAVWLTVTAPAAAPPSARPTVATRS
jgi:hypothetical protein